MATAKKANRPFDVVQPSGTYIKDGVVKTIWLDKGQAWITDDGKGVRIKNCINLATKIVTMTDAQGNKYNAMRAEDMIIKFVHDDDDVPASKPKKAKKAPTIVPVEDEEPDLPF